MEILLKVNDTKAGSLLEFLNTIPYIRAKKLTPENSLFLEELEASIGEVNLAKAGKIKLKTAEQLLDEI